ncbi:MAG: DUF547 domain-containing protein [Bacteroidota bacterium]
MKNILLAVITTLALSGCTSIHFNGDGAPPSHDAWTGLVQKYVNADGLVDYKGFISDSEKLNTYLTLISNNPPGKSWSENDKIAYWLNAYNAFTIKLIIDHYPLKSIKDLGPKDQVIFINTPWDIKFFEIGGKTMTLNRIEHRILRKDFTEPRIHFALNCASMSCPKLRREAYVGNKLDEQLTDQAKDFLRDESRNKITASTPKVSSIFKFYGSDMTKWSGKTLIGYINQYSPVQINEDAELQYLDYDWSLNKQ